MAGRARFGGALAALLLVGAMAGTAAAQATPDGFKVRIGPRGAPGGEDPLAPVEAPAEAEAPSESRPAAGEPERAPRRGRVVIDEPVRIEGEARGRDAKAERARIRKVRRIRAARVEAVTPLEAARRLEAAGGALVELDRALVFRHDSIDLRPESAAALDEVADALRARPDLRLVLIEGHADEPGALRYNQRLSEGRAGAVRRALVARGVAPERLVAYGYGETRPVTPDPPQNRRVVFRVVEGERAAPAGRRATAWGQAAVVARWGAVEFAASPGASPAPPAVEMPASEVPTSESPSGDPRRPASAIALRIAPVSPAAPAREAPARETPARSGVDLPDDALDWRPLELRAQLGEGHDIRTGPDGGALLRLPDLTRLWLGPDTRVRLSEVAHDAADGETHLTLTVRRGTVRAMLNPLERRISRTRIALPGGVLEVVAADLDLRITEAGVGRLHVDRGSLEVSVGEAAARSLYAGQAMALGGSDPAPRTRLRPPEVVTPFSGRFDRAPPLVWDAVPDAAGYRVEVAADVDFHRPVEEARTEALRFEPRLLAPGRQYFWRVRAIDAAGFEGSASRVYALHVAPRPEPPPPPAAARLTPR